MAPDHDAAMSAWAAEHGGEVRDQRLERVTAIGASLSPDVAVPITYHVLRSGTITAFSWHSGDIYLSSALVDAATDDEVAAAIAHEMGHLQSDARKAGASSLRGGSLEIEEAADQAGVGLLVASGRSQKPLVSLLSKAIAASPAGSTREDMQMRVRALCSRPSAG